MGSEFWHLSSHSVPEEDIPSMEEDNRQSVNEAARELEEAGATGIEYIIGICEVPQITQDSKDYDLPGYDSANDGRAWGSFDYQYDQEDE